MDGWVEGGMERGRESLPSFFFFGSTWSQTQGQGYIYIYIPPFGFMPNSRDYFFSSIVAFYLFLLLVIVVCSMCVVFS